MGLGVGGGGWVGGMRPAGVVFSSSSFLLPFFPTFFLPRSLSSLWIHPTPFFHPLFYSLLPPNCLCVCVCVCVCRWHLVNSFDDWLRFHPLPPTHHPPPQRLVCVCVCVRVCVGGEWVGGWWVHKGNGWWRVGFLVAVFN